MSCEAWHPQPGRRYLAKASCPEHGDYVIRIRFDHDPDGSYRVREICLMEGTNNRTVVAEIASGQAKLTQWSAQAQNKQNVSFNYQLT
jgi:hypothetical protein